MNRLYEYIERLADLHTLSFTEYEELITGQSTALSRFAAEKAVLFREKYYGKDVYIRGLIEIGNICRNDCLYCGIRKSNANCKRYILTEEQILSCCEEGYSLGFRTFVLQGGEGTLSVEKICSAVSRIKERFPDCAVTLSLGEYEKEDYERMYEAGADRYLLRHETADAEHYQKLHPREMSFYNRMRCLDDLKEIGFQVGCGFMVGSPYQTPKSLSYDLKFIETFSPDMCGIGPFIHQKDTPFGVFPSGSAEQTLFLLSLIRLIKPSILLPATTALGTIVPGGREMGLMAGANVVMPNLSPAINRKMYALYDDKLSSGEEAAQNLALLKETGQKTGYRIVTARGDVIK